ncbi:MAG: AAA family ATPase, partial [Acidobacteriota bacterium]
MELKGFKSFYQPTQIRFTDGITAVVGPNGCGKSNLSDAISWVLGSQSSKALRGARMEDVIFNGSEKRGPLAMAEVTLSLAWQKDGRQAEEVREPDSSQPSPELFKAAPAAMNRGDADREQSAGNGHSPFTLPSRPGETVSVTRRLFRNGESEYRIDGTRCRLKDVQDLMRAARIGSRTYSVIEQGRISSLLSARPQERKELIEEAGGILGFKARRRAALLKLEATEANLARLRDLISEVRRQANSLKRQAAAARRFRRNTEERDELQRLLFFLENRHLAGALQGLDAEVETLAAEDAAAAADQGRREARLQALRQRLDEEGRGAAERREEWHKKERENDRLTAGLASLAER